MRERWCFLLELVASIFDDKQSEKGFVLMESLVGLVLLGIVAISMVQVLPILLEADMRLDKEQYIYNRLFEFQDNRLLDGGFFETSAEGSGVLAIREGLVRGGSFEYRILLHGDELCARYRWRSVDEREICL